jgi:DNA-binding transcriptional LysR family regulator
MNRSAIPDLSSRELLAVCTIAEHGSFMAASLTLNISQPALTRTVQRVEQAIGLEVFRKASSCLPLAKNSVQRFWISWRGGDHNSWLY